MLRFYLLWGFLGGLLLLQWPLWFARGSLIAVWKSEEQLTALQKSNEQLSIRNAALNAEIQDLKHGSAAIEERARYQLGMIKSTETFYQVLP